MAIFGKPAQRKAPSAKAAERDTKREPKVMSARELALTELLLSRQGRVVSKEQIIDHLFGFGDDVGSNAIEVYVHRVRKKLEPLGIDIRTVRGMGYLLDKFDERV